MLDHLGNKDLHAVNVAEEVKLGDPVNIAFRQLPDRSGNGAASVVAENINPSEGVQRQLQECLDVLIQRDVGFLCDGLCAEGLQLGDDTARCIAVNVVHNAFHTTLCGFYRDGTPYAATAAGNNKNLIFKFFHDLVLLLSSN